MIARLTFSSDTSTDLEFGDEKLHVSMLPNPSHLEAANPVTVGKARAKQLNWKEGHYSDESSLMGDKVWLVLGACHHFVVLNEKANGHFSRDNPDDFHSYSDVPVFGYCF